MEKRRRWRGMLTEMDLQENLCDWHWSRDPTQESRLQLAFLGRPHMALCWVQPPWAELVVFKLFFPLLFPGSGTLNQNKNPGQATKGATLVEAQMGTEAHPFLLFFPPPPTSFLQGTPGTIEHSSESPMLDHFCPTRIWLLLYFSIPACQCFPYRESPLDSRRRGQPGFGCEDCGQGLPLWYVSQQMHGKVQCGNRLRKASHNRESVQWIMVHPRKGILCRP